MICVALFTVYELAEVLPNFTAVAPINFVPVIVTDVLPPSGPATGDLAVMVGLLHRCIGRLMKSADCRREVTVISTVPAEPTGEVAVIEVALFTVYEAAAIMPNFTAVAPVKPVPVIVTGALPPSGRATGDGH